MNETRMRDALQAFVHDGEPVMGLTASEVLAAGRRSRRTRRLAGLAGAGLAVAVAGAGILMVSAGGSTGTDYAAAASCPVPPGSRPPGVIAADRPLSPQQVEWAATSLTCHLNRQVPRLLPTARFAQVPGAPAGPLVGFSHGGEPPWGNRVDALALIRDAEGTGDLTISIGVVEQSAAARAEGECRRSTVGRCSVQRGPDGETVLLSTEADSGPPLSQRDVIVRVYRGHNEINLQASNTDRQSVNGLPPAATRPDPVLSAEQAVQLALSPELYLFP
ncbi:hypothetical protein [Actinoplanes sp. CA-252034]|uniref:hypothetical protein n=1 Tax=Actinoplanes sp. CA-252034 TaxID=3239906 RepID=UPI003D991F7C